MSEAPGSLTANSLYFMRMLRELGLPVGTGRAAEFLEALDLIDLASRRDVYFAARALLLRDIEKLDRFDRAFELFWSRRRTAGGPTLRMPSSRRPSDGADEDDRLKGPRDGQADPGEQTADQTQQELLVSGRYSPVELLRQVDFGDLNQDELDQIDAAIRAIPFLGRLKTSRRYQPGKGRRLDLRAVLRSGSRHAGEWLKPSHLQRGRKDRKLLVFLDVSGSMRPYSERYLQLCYTLTRRRPTRVESFAVGTRLTRLTHNLRRGDHQTAIERATREIPDWGGGTRLGKNLRTFNREWSSLAMGSGPIAILISDGWDRGDIELLGSEIARLSRLSHRLWWLNPLMDSPGYELATRALVSAAPHVDAFLPAGNLARLEQVLKMLEKRLKVDPLPAPARQGRSWVGETR